MSFDFLFKPIRKVNLEDDGFEIVVTVMVVTGLIRLLLEMAWGV
jgi:hypothetical protein